MENKVDERASHTSSIQDPEHDDPEFIEQAAVGCCFILTDASVHNIDSALYLAIHQNRTFI